MYISTVYEESADICSYHQHCEHQRKVLYHIREGNSRIKSIQAVTKETF